MGAQRHGVSEWGGGVLLPLNLYRI